MFPPENSDQVKIRSVLANRSDRVNGKRSNIKQLLDEVFVICRIINVDVRVITLSETLIILHITKTESNNCFIIHFQRKELKIGTQCVHVASPTQLTQ